MTLTVTFKKLVEDDDKLLIGENNVNEDPHIQDNSKNATVKKSDRFKNYVIAGLLGVCLVLVILLCWNGYLTYYQTQIHETGDAINENNATAPVTRKEFQQMYRVLENYATMQDATDEDILYLGKKLQAVEGILNKTNAHVEGILNKTNAHVEEILHKTNAHVDHLFSVGFQAFLHSDKHRQYSNKVQFDGNVNFNLGNGYSKSGVFTVPPGKGGLYYFNTFLQFNDYESGRFELVVGGVTRCWIQGDDNGSGNDFDNGSCESLQHLKPGDTAYVRRSSTEYPVKYAVFAGFLLKSDA